MWDKELTRLLHEWLARISAVEQPPDEVIAYNVGLLETEDGYAAYLIGASSFDEEDGDWACDEAFTPTERYLAFPTNVIKGKTWEAVLPVVTEAVKSFLETPASQTSFLRKAEAVTVGFDDGDLLRIK